MPPFTLLLNPQPFSCISLLNEGNTYLPYLLCDNYPLLGIDLLSVVLVDLGYNLID